MNKNETIFSKIVDLGSAILDFSEIQRYQFWYGCIEGKYTKKYTFLRLLVSGNKESIVYFPFLTASVGLFSIFLSSHWLFLSDFSKWNNIILTYKKWTA